MNRPLHRWSAIRHGLAICLIGLATPAAFAADGSGAVNDTALTVEFAGGPYVIPLPLTLLLPDPICVEDTPLCYTYDLTVALSDELRLAPGNEFASLDIALKFEGGQNDLDLYVYDAAGNLVTSAAGGAGVQEAVSVPLDLAPNGVYRIQVVPWLVVGPVSFTGTISVVGLEAADAKSSGLLLGAGGLGSLLLLPLAGLAALRSSRRPSFFAKRGSD